MNNTSKLSPSVPAFPRYSQAPGLWVITTFFNPCGYEMRRTNYEIFIRSMRESGIPCLTVECAFDDQPFQLDEALDVIQVRGTCLWQKERLLNLAASWLPPNAKYIAWLDCDILFTNQNWAVETAKLLESHAVVQVFEKCLRLNQENDPAISDDEVTSFGAIVPNNQELISCGRYDRHGHTGYGWAMRREIFDKVGLYEYAVVGTADHYMAHAIYNDYGFCIQNALKKNRSQLNHLKEWGGRFYNLVQGNFSVVPGKILHLWHGDLINRRYIHRTHNISDLGFDPFTDIYADPGHPFRWQPEMNKSGLREYFENYFSSRREDG